MRKQEATHDAPVLLPARLRVNIMRRTRTWGGRTHPRRGAKRRFVPAWVWMDVPDTARAAALFVGLESRLPRGCVEVTLPDTGEIVTVRLADIERR